MSTKAERRDRIEEQAGELYAALFAEEQARRRTEWEREFDTLPLRLNGADIHRVVMRQMAARVQDE